MKILIYGAGVVGCEPAHYPFSIRADTGRHGVRKLRRHGGKRPPRRLGKRRPGRKAGWGRMKERLSQDKLREAVRAAGIRFGMAGRHGT